MFLRIQNFISTYKNALSLIGIVIFVIGFLVITDRYIISLKLSSYISTPADPVVTSSTAPVNENLPKEFTADIITTIYCYNSDGKMAYSEHFKYGMAFQGKATMKSLTDDKKKVWWYSMAPFLCKEIED